MNDRDGDVRTDAERAPGGDEPTDAAAERPSGDDAGHGGPAEPAPRDRDLRFWRGVVFAVAIAIGLGLGTRRVVDLAAAEIDRNAGWVVLDSTRDATGAPTPHRELGRIAVQPGETLVVDVCSRGALAPETWLGPRVSFVLWQPVRHDVAYQLALDETALARARRSRDGEACLEVARGRDIRPGGTFALEAVWEDPAVAPPDEPVRVRFSVHRGTPGLSGMLAWGIVLAGVIGLAAGARRAPFGPFAPGSPPLALALLGVGLLLVGMGAASMLPVPGAPGVLARGVMVGGVGLALALTLGGRWIGPALRAPGARLLSVFAPVLGVGLWAATRLCIQLLPAGGEAPIEAAVAWPSGLLAAALVSVLVPAAEELFFRGFLFGALEERAGTFVSVAATTVLFVLAHLPQAHGAWGALLALGVVGLALGALRGASGAVLPCIIAHLTHNAVLSGTGLLFPR